MYTQIFLVTSVRGMVLPPQIFANASLSFFGAKMPFPASFMAFLPAVFFSAVIFFKVAFVIVVFVVFATVVFAVVLVVVVISSEERMQVHAGL